MAARTRERILSEVRGLLTEGEIPTVAQIAAAAGVSRASFYRAFDSREALLAALEVQPEPATRERILEAALDMVGEKGLTAMSMDELATRSGVSRATLYRLFPGKPALFANLLRTYSPLEPVTLLVDSMRDRPPDEVMPEIARVVFKTVYGPGAPRIGVLRSIFLEVSSVSPDAEEGARDLVGMIFASVGGYVMTQMSEGRLRRMHPLLAMQSFVGPIFFHLLTRSMAERLLGLDIDGEQAVVDLARAWLRAMKPDEEGDPDG
jgi:AcrR family transcriptional regulator